MSERHWSAARGHDRVHLTYVPPRGVRPLRLTANGRPLLTSFALLPPSPLFALEALQDLVNFGSGGWGWPPPTPIWEYRFRLFDAPATLRFPGWPRRGHLPTLLVEVGVIELAAPDA